MTDYRDVQKSEPGVQTAQLAEIETSDGSDSTEDKIVIDPDSVINEIFSAAIGTAAGIFVSGFLFNDGNS